MTMRITRPILLLTALLGAAGCSGQDADQTPLERLNSSSVTAPDEFKVLPRRPLVLPSDLEALPAPAPGQGNRADLTPIRDLEVALSGREGRGTASASDTALVRAAARGGVTPNIRGILAEEDADWRANNKGRILERLFLRNEESITYRDMILDPVAELRRLRARGIRVPQLPAE